MSAGYASRLSQYPNKGVVGLPESFDTCRALHNKLQELAKLMRTSQRIVVLTGAGISTAADIPDFRGPNGIWTLEKRRQSDQKDSRNAGKKRVRKRKFEPTDSGNNCNHEVSSSSSSAPLIDFVNATPTLTHRAITRLSRDSKIHYVVTQNVDGLHRRSGLSRSQHSTVHGCVSTEKCSNPKCGVEVFLDKEVEGLSFQPTGSCCEECGSTMHDILLDWEDMVLDLDLVTEHCKQADLVLCLGSSLRINPVGTLPLLAKKFVIVNLQPTPFDERATLIIRAKVDDVMERLMVQLGYPSEWIHPINIAEIERKWTPPNGDNEAFAKILMEKSSTRLLNGNEAGCNRQTSRNA